MTIKTNNTMRIAMTLVLVFFLFPLYGQSKEDWNLQQTKEKALKGESACQSQLVSYYYNEEKNYSEAIKWCYILLANQDADDYDKEYANRILGCCALNGVGREQSIDDAITYWKRSVGYKGDRSALLLAEVYADELKDSVESIKWYKQAAELENRDAAYFLAQLYENGCIMQSPYIKRYFPGITKDISQAAKFYEIYIKLMGSMGNEPENYSKLLYKLAQWYFSGEGNLTKNFSKAFTLFHDALERDCESKEEFRLSSDEEGEALWCLSVCYRNGYGVNKDNLKARRYTTKAAEKGNRKAIDYLNDLNAITSP